MRKRSFSTKFALLFVGLLSFGGLVSCGAGRPGQNKETIIVTIDPKTAGADQLIEAAEMLLTPETLPQALMLIQLAENAAPSDLKVQFYSKALRRIQLSKGILSRIRPLAQAAGEIQNLDNSLLEFEESPTKKYLLNGPQDIRTVADAQEFLRQYRETSLEFYRFLKAQSDLKLTLNLNPSVLSNIRPGKKNCWLRAQPESSSSNYAFYEVVCREIPEIEFMEVDLADVLALRQATAGEIVSISLNLAWHLEGIQKLVAASHVPGSRFRKDLSHREIFETLRNIPEFGQIRNDHRLSLAQELAPDLVSAWQWALDHQDQLCPAEKTEPRKTHILDSYCLKPKESRLELARFRAAQTGPIQEVIALRDFYGFLNYNSTMVNYSSVVSAPPTDLKTLFPTQYSSCGKVSRLSDPSMAGLLPMADGNELLEGCTWRDSEGGRR